MSDDVRKIVSDVTLHHGDARTIWRDLPKHAAHAIVTSPPYFGLRDYGVDGQIGLEATPDEYVDGLADLLTDWGTSVLRPDGSLWLNLGDTYAAYNNNRGASKSISGRAEVLQTDRPGIHGDHPAKCLLMIPERVALALIGRGWILRNRVVWHKVNGMPSSATDRLATKHEALFHFVRQQRYHYDLDAIREPHGDLRQRVNRQRTGEDSAVLSRGVRHIAHQRTSEGNPAGANPGDVWTIPTQPYPEAHFAVFPPELVRRPILATVPEGGTVCDPFAGAGTTAVMARRLGRRSLLCELNGDYCDIIADQLKQDVLPFAEVSA